MRDLKHYSGYLALLSLAILTQNAGATEIRDRDDDGDKYEVYWKNKRTPHRFQHKKHHLKRSKEEVCTQSGWSLCASSVGGGCCPDNFECGTASCYATTAGPTSACGFQGYYNCPLTAGAGSCCPVGFICNGDTGGCDPPEGSTATCATSYFNCPNSLGGGCCPNGLVCGSGLCYNETPQTYKISEARSYTSKGHKITTTITTTTVITNEPPTSSGSAGASVIQQLIPSTVAKMPAVEATTGSGSGVHGGLSSGALGGIIAAVIVVLVAIVTAAAFIILRLRRTEKNVKEAAESRNQSSNSGGGGNGTSRDGDGGGRGAHKAGFGQPSVSEVDASDIDPLAILPIMRPSPEPRSRSTSATAADRSLTETPNFMSSNSGTSTPPMWGTPFYVPSSDASDGRQSSLDNHAQPDSYFTTTAANTAAANRMSAAQVSVDSGQVGPYSHSRQPSDTSELEAPHGKSELEPNVVSPDGRGSSEHRRSGSITQPSKVHTHVRRNSDLSSPAAGNRGRGDSGAGTVSPQPLKTVNEVYELHGYYGPVHELSGRTDR
ncbi:hypothetical protein F5Y16DRAFT_368591 [Xylariaceae sp. FL0255]|nr:hypothetical protein F5Y16DRAFT_368591 [Xylariaceae sp. FL0255]